MNILVTGAAGFIGFHLSQRYLKEGHTVVGLDNLNSYYDPRLKLDRLRILQAHKNFVPAIQDLADAKTLNKLFNQYRFDIVVNLAAQAGVRYSLEDPASYVNSNLVGFANLLEAARNYQTGHFVYASSSSVYGLNEKVPFSVEDNVDHPISLYAASKKSNELMAHSYSHLFRIPCTGLRFFTVYGPWGRPDMALFKFTRAILENKPIDVYNNGQMKRDFTYIDDIVEGVVRISYKKPEPNKNWNPMNPDPASSTAPYTIFNIGNNNSVELGVFIETLEKVLGRKAQKNLMPMQAGDVSSTYANIDSLQSVVGFKPQTDLTYGIEQFVNWYRDYYKV
ncbi:NAD-dependent epimerase [Desulfovibrio litoralis]|uniref:UDP-glucuronate 4-epimerase n=1 Tax=Desulfovibrio litoralis DSM 11393 TaxID=1121455 RepID=A0A1M7TL57_9BACT|nr:NAD-dependent epimerase [Desulfovibrio litoralis]SHN71378.1 UDP-glucuronate 4-epimerase [Desulfovibrio litoralis DSM 11393]